MTKLGTAMENDIRLALGKQAPHCRIFRNLVARAWVGRRVSYERGTAVLEAAKPVDAGLCPGSADLIGWSTQTITPEMVGQKVAIFTSLEVKSGSGSADADQKNWRDRVLAAGGIAAVVRSPDEAVLVVSIGK